MESIAEFFGVSEVEAGLILGAIALAVLALIISAIVIIYKSQKAKQSAQNQNQLQLKKNLLNSPPRAIQKLHMGEVQLGL